MMECQRTQGSAVDKPGVLVAGDEGVGMEIGRRFGPCVAGAEKLQVERGGGHVSLLETRKPRVGAAGEWVIVQTALELPQRMKKTSKDCHCRRKWGKKPALVWGAW